MSRKGLPAEHQAALTEKIEVWRTLDLSIKERVKAFEAEIQPDKELAGKIEALIVAELRANKQSQVKLSKAYGAEHPGTAYIIKSTSARVADAGEFFAYVLQSGNTDLLQKRVSSDAVSIYSEAHKGELPPGVDSSTRLKLGFRVDNR
jgi:hypothetical protein